MARPHDAQSRAAPAETERGGHGNPVARILLGVAITALALLLLWIAGQVPLVIFAGVLLGLLLSGLGQGLSGHSVLSYGWALTLVIVAVVAVIGLGGWLLVPRVAGQFDQLLRELSATGETIRQFLSQYEWSGSLLEGWSPADLTSNIGGLLNRMLGLASTLLGALSTAVIIIFVGVYTAADPGLYTGGMLRLFPLGYRARMAEILREAASRLRWWLIGRAVAMFTVAVITAAGLWLIGVPLALTLGILTGLLDFIPIVGPIIAAVLALLVALAQGATQALYVLLLYVVIQTIEGYLLTPLIQERAVSLPPALLIAVLVLMGVFFGMTGVALAAPLAAAGLVVVRMAYVEDVLGDRSGGGA